MTPARDPFVGTKAGVVEFKSIVDAEDEKESNLRWRHTWFVWAMWSTGLATLFLALFVLFAVLYAQQYPQCSLKDMHVTSDVAHSLSTYPILQQGTAFYRNAAYGHKLTDCETWLLRGLAKMPPPPTGGGGALNGIQSNS